MITKPQSCPGLEQHKSLSSYEGKCLDCGKEVEIFSDELHKPRSCPGCKKPLDTTKFTLVAGITQR